MITGPAISPSPKTPALSRRAPRSTTSRPHPRRRRDRRPHACDLRQIENYGYHRIGAALRHQPIVLNSKQMRRLIRVHDLHLRHHRRFITTTDSAHDHPISPDQAKHRSSTLRPSSPSPTSPTSRSRPASSISPPSSMPRRAESSLIDQPVRRCPTDAGGPQGRAPYSSTSSGLHASFRSRGPVRLLDLPPTARRHRLVGS